VTVFNHVEQPLTSAELEAVCHNVSELARATRGQLSRLRVSCGETTVELEWAAEQRTGAVAELVPDLPAEEENGEFTLVTAPLVGTFYYSPEPGAPPFVSVGDVIEPGRVIGILEAMKLMNPIEAQHGGRIVEILVPDATPVEFAQPLIALAHDD
jgi:acetyl-CoA carboxylase biotin carboxyl carrier protein